MRCGKSDGGQKLAQGWTRDGQWQERKISKIANQ